ncbi:ATP-binding cassette domain-containing protein [Patulibacter brassicae]|jgi:ABC-type multidrug transport system ATPase subunit|uniref:ATP-binding cassette domain-containing protein n=1 Tax=Patulibacter brassicae TaxID=1705717 RepID=A0ABU4VLH5_9ACTN|nr:ATP-binding cassette domain-containing protein [Patulibacter brassicae]MDX8152633.1 ATP-binding cassette domain-containing protein [Patulibacter brassicae]
MPDEPTDAVALDGLVRRRGERLVLRDLTLAVPRGATVALLGPNGAGKSTLLRVLAGLLRPSRGGCRVLGHALPRERAAVKGRIGVLAHEPLLLRDLTVRENLVHRGRLLGGEAATPARIDALLEATDLVGRAAYPVAALSRGLTQRAAAAAALLGDPELLLLDEPLANLDPVAAERLGALLGPAPRSRFGAAGPRTRIVAGHDPEAALAESDLVVGLRGGALALLARPADVTDAEIGALYR